MNPNRGTSLEVLATSSQWLGEKNFGEKYAYCPTIVQLPGEVNSSRRMSSQTHIPMPQ